MKRSRSPNKSVQFLATLAIAISVIFLPVVSAVGADLLPFEPDDTLEEIRCKIDYNGYDFSVEENWVFNMPSDGKASFFNCRRPLYPRRHTVNDEIGPLAEHLGRRMLPASFDWRDYFGRSYVGPIQDQGGCGASYAFAAAAAAEVTYNWANGRFGDNRAEFSEAFIAFCLSDHYTGFTGCIGANHDYDELQALVDWGVCDRDEYPYTPIQQNCPFADYPPLTQFDSWHRIPCNDIEAIKTAIMTYGAVAATVYIDSAFEAYSEGVYENTNTTCPASPCYYTESDHWVALVGWDDSPPEGGGGCWILRNSWGESWGEGGYMRIRYNSAAVACSCAYLIYQPAVAGALEIASFNVSVVGSVPGEVTTRIFKGLKPDIALLQEWGMADGAHRGYVDEAFGPEFDYVLGWAPGASITWRQNNGVVSRWAMQTKGDWRDPTGPNDRSAFAWAEIALPGDRNLLAVSVHLKAGDTLEDRTDRVAQANAIKDYIEDYQSSQGFDGYVVVGGDMNFNDYSESALAAFDTFLEPLNHIPADHEGNPYTNLDREKPYDWVMPNQLLDARHTTLTIGTGNYQYEEGIVFDSDVFWFEGGGPFPTPPSGTELWNLPPVRYGDSHSGVTNHMSVMKAFDALPAPTATPRIPSTPVPSITPPLVMGPISGRVYDRETGVGIPDVYVQALAGGQTAAGYSGKNGYYTTDTLNAGIYTVLADTFRQPEYRRQYYNQKSDATTATLVPSNAGGIDFPLYRRWVYPTPTPVLTPVFFPASIDTADYDGDGTSDLAVFRSATGLWAVRGMTRAYFGKRGDLPTSGDYNGDGTSDFAVFRGASGLWAARGVTRVYFGRDGDIPIPGDYSGNGVADLAVFRGAYGLWAIRSLTRIYFGRIDDLPAPFKGSGWRKEIAIFRPSSGLWAVKEATRAYFGRSGDIPIPGDYSGAGFVDLAIFRGADGLWALRGISRFYLGTSGDRPVPGNYGGTIRAAPAIFRDSTGLWALRGLTRVYFGLSGDLPVSGLAIKPSGTSPSF